MNETLPNKGTGKMTPVKNKVELEILNIQAVTGMVMLLGKLLTGDIYGMGDEINNFRCIETGGRWKMAALGFLTPKERKEDTRFIGIEHIDGSKDLEPGFTLVSEKA